MAGLSISGLASGIDTTSVINSLIAVAAGPQNALKTQLNAENNKLASYQSINSKLAALQTASDALKLTATWGATTATSSDSSVIATGSATALAGTSTTLTVTKLAQAQVSTSTTSDPANAADSAAGLSISIGGGAAKSITLAGNSASDVVTAVNSANLGIRAALVKTSDGSSVLQFSSTTTGAASAFTISGLNSPVQNLNSAQNATATVGDVSSGGYTISSATNTFTDAVPGVTFTVSKANVTTTIGVAADSSSISTAIQGLITAANSAIGTVGYTTAKGGDLAGQSSVGAIGQSLLGVVAAGSNGKAYDSVGVGITSTGSMTFDANAFATAYAKDPIGTQAMIQTALADSLSKLSSLATDTTNGVIGQAVTVENAQISSLNKQIATWDTKLANQKDALTGKYAAMEAALSRMKSQSSYLTSMFASLDSSASSSSSHG